MKASDMFKQTPIAPSNLKPILPENVDLNAVTDDILKRKAIDDAAGEAKRKQWAEEMVAARVKAQREDDAAAREEERLRLWHADCAKKRADGAAAKATAAADKAKRQFDARQKELKAKLSTFIATCVDVASDLEEIEDKNCVQVRLLRESVNALLESFPGVAQTGE